MMDIVMASDENYAPHLATLIVSICENNKGERLDFHILNGGISNHTLERIFNIKKLYDNVVFYNYNVTDEIILEKLGLSDIYKDRSITAYARIFIPELLSYDIHTCLYLDCDGIVLSGKSLKELFNDNSIYCISGVKDVLPHTPSLSTRPWVRGCKHPLKNEYIKYRNMTEFSPFELLPDNRKMYLKILGVLYYNLPYNIYKRVHSILYKIFR